jgi:hypothetical protein
MFFIVVASLLINIHALKTCDFDSNYAQNRRAQEALASQNRFDSDICLSKEELIASSYISLLKDLEEQRTLKSKIYPPSADFRDEKVKALIDKGLLISSLKKLPKGMVNGQLRCFLICFQEQYFMCMTLPQEIVPNSWKNTISILTFLFITSQTRLRYTAL